MSRAPTFAALLAMSLIVSCGDDPVRILDGQCVVGDEHRIAVPDGPVVDGVALASAGAHAWAVWSERAGAFARRLDASGAPSEAPLRIGPACGGGVAAEVQRGADGREELVVACGRRGDDARGDGGGVQLVAIHDGGIATLAALGALGPDGGGVALAIDPEGIATAGWREARGAITQTWMQRIAPGAMPERLSSPRFRGSRPSMLWHRDRLLVAWAETWENARGRAAGRVMVRAGTRAARPVQEIAFDAPLPVLREGAGGDAVLAFRDRRPVGSRTRVQLARVRDDGSAVDGVVAGSHANAVGEAMAIGCGEDVFVVAPRTHSRTERLASVRRYSRELAPLGPEMQIYEHGAAFEHADARCVDGGLVVLVASRRSRIHERASVRAARVICRDE